MSITRPIAAVLGAMLILGAGATAVLGSTVQECEGQLQALQASTADAEAAFAPKSFANAQLKLVDAADKLAEGKFAGAAAKVADYRALLTSLATAPKPKLDPSVAEGLIAQATSVEACLALIETS